MQKKIQFPKAHYLRTIFGVLSKAKEGITVITFFVVPVVSAFVALIAFLVSLNTASIVKTINAHEQRITMVEEAYEVINGKLDKLIFKLIGPTTDSSDGGGN